MLTWSQFLLVVVGMVVLLLRFAWLLFGGRDEPPVVLSVGPDPSSLHPMPEQVERARTQDHAVLGIALDREEPDGSIEAYEQSLLQRFPQSPIEERWATLRWLLSGTPGEEKRDLLRKTLDFWPLDEMPEEAVAYTREHLQSILQSMNRREPKADDSSDEISRLLSMYSLLLKHREHSNLR